MERKLIAAAVSSALALPMAAHAVEGSVSGHVNRAILYVDGVAVDGVALEGELLHVDANSSETRFRFTGSEDIGSGSSVGVQLEIGRPGNWRTRHANVHLSGGFGKLTIGQASAATDGMAHADLGGPSWLGGATNWCAYISTASAACPSNDGGRMPVLRYDTPALGPASIAGSFGNADYWDIKATIAGDMGGGAGYDLRIGYIAEGDTAVGVGSTLTVSGAVGFGQGTSVAVAWSNADADGIDASHDYWYTKLDHSYGDGSVGIYYKTGEYDVGVYDVLDVTAGGSFWGVGIGHNVGGGATAYAGFRRLKRDLFRDVDLALAGMRVTFN